MAGVGAAAFSSDGAFLASCSWDPVINLWSIENQQELFTFRTDLKRAGSVLLSPDRSVWAVGVSKSWQGSDAIWLLYAPRLQKIEAKKHSVVQVLPAER